MFYSVGVTKDELEGYINVPEVQEGRTNLPSQIKILEDQERRERQQKEIQQKLAEAKSTVNVKELSKEDESDLAGLLDM